MDSGFLIFAPNLILLLLFVFYLWQRQSLKNFDWVTMVCITLGISLLALVVMLILRNQSATGLLQILFIAVPAVSFILFLLFLTRVITVEQVQAKLRLDERITVINAKSARNALVAVYLSTLINLIIFSNISTLLLFEILGISLAVYLSSMVIYYFHFRAF